MTHQESVLLVKFSSTLNGKDLMRTCEEDLNAFRSVPGLLQKYYIAEEQTGAISGFYIFRSKADREAFWNSPLAKNIPERYGVVAASLRVETYEMAIVLNDVVFA